MSRAWVDRLKQRRRETGEIAPRRQPPDGTIDHGMHGACRFALVDE